MGENCRDCGYFITQKSQSICNYGDKPCLACGKDVACKYFTDRPKAQPVPEPTSTSPSGFTPFHTERVHPERIVSVSANGVVRTLAELILAKEQNINVKVGFGRWKGRNIREVPEGYLRWAKKTLTNGTVVSGWYCPCGHKLGDKKPDSDAEFVLVCPTCGRDHSWGT